MLRELLYMSLRLQMPDKWISYYHPSALRNRTVNGFYLHEYLSVLPLPEQVLIYSE